LALLDALDQLDQNKTVQFIASCQNFDGGFGMVEGAESHAAYGLFLKKKKKTL
jgi:geranylgeranyl transferase type-2 subunit beta